MSKTNQDITIEAYNEVVVIPKGTKTTNFTACGFDPECNFVDDFSWYKPELTGFARKMALHDFEHYGIKIDKKFVEV